MSSAADDRGQPPTTILPGPDAPPTAEREVRRLHVTRGARHYSATISARSAGSPSEVTATVCDANGELQGEITGTAPEDDIAYLAQLLGQLGGMRTPAPSPTPHATATTRVPRGGQPWTAEAEQLCEELGRAGAQPEELALLLGRSTESVRWKLHKLGLANFPADLAVAPAAREPAVARPAPAYKLADLQTTYPKSHTRWTDGDDALLRERAAQGATVEDLMDEFGRNQNAIVSRLRKVEASGPVMDSLDQYPTHPSVP